MKADVQNPASEIQQLNDRFTPVISTGTVNSAGK
jgi:hypothetical protein